MYNLRFKTTFILNRKACLLNLYKPLYTSGEYILYEECLTGGYVL